MRNNKYYKHIIESVLSGIGAIIALSFIGLIAEEAGTMMIIAPFGATAVLLFSLPSSPVSKPLNILSGYLIASIIGAIILTYSDGTWLYIGIGLGTSIMLMQLLKVLHPPAGATYLIVTQGALTIHSIAPVFIGLLLLMIMGIGINKIQTSFTSRLES